MANFEAFHGVISSSINLLFLKSVRRHDFAMSYPRSALIGINSVQVFFPAKVYNYHKKKLEGKIESLKHIHIRHGQIDYRAGSCASVLEA